MIILEGEQIKAFAYLQVYHKLKMEVDHPNGPKWRGSQMNWAKQIMEVHGVECKHRTKAKVLEVYTNFLKERGILHG